MKVGREVSKGARDHMAAADMEAVWEGKYRCCGMPVKGTPREIARAIEKHLADGCEGAKEL